MTAYRTHLLERFRQQEVFTEGYSALYRQLFRHIAEWLEHTPDDPLMVWLLDVAAVREPLDITLLLPAGVHRAVLAGLPDVAELASFYPTAGGTLSAGDPAFGPALYRAIDSQRSSLAPFMQGATVQTNETSRGLSWLWPLAQTAWPEVHLLELGASAGLNLLADGRSYRLTPHEPVPDATLTLGRASAVQFEVATDGDVPWAAMRSHNPGALSRTGVDLAPFPLTTAADELTLASFVWGDQPVRLRRLREGIAARSAAAAIGDAPTLHPVRLPDELAEFLITWEPRDEAPVVIFNTTVTMYLPDGREGLRAVIEPWARRQGRPVLWVQWEADQAAGEPPEWGWQAWTSELWPGFGGAPQAFHLAWVHPHAAGLEWLPGAADWLRNAQSLR
jgi:hypothetical protein